MKEVRFSLVFFVLLVLASISVEAQSTNVEFPTPVTSDTISGKIKARDLGDPRSTIYYYIFEASQGDVFLKIEAANLNGDIDIFYADSLRPLTKISFYADSSPTQTGREIYLRKSEKLILKIEGRTPNDDPATYSIKFEGSFLAMAAAKITNEPKVPEVKSETDTEPEVKVNSVGTIIETKPKPTPTPKETVARTNRRRNTKPATTPESVSTVKTPKTTNKKPKVEPESEKESEKKPEVVVTDNLPKSEETTETVKEGESTKEAETPKEAVKPKTTAKKTTGKKTTTKKPTVTKTETEPQPKKPTKAEELAVALENVRLIVDFKDGRKVERPMNDVVRFSVDKGFLTIVNKDGSIGRYSILEISKISVE